MHTTMKCAVLNVILSLEQDNMISFIIGTKNRPKELKRLIEFLVAQPDNEIIVADEGDNKWVLDYGVKYIRGKYQGNWHYGIKNEAVGLAECDYLCFPQDDAVYSEDFIPKMQKGDLNICDWKHEGTIHKGKPQTCSVDIGGFTVKRELFKPFDLSNQADGHFVEALKDKATIIEEVLYEKQ